MPNKAPARKLAGYLVANRSKQSETRDHSARGGSICGRGVVTGVRGWAGVDP